MNAVALELPFDFRDPSWLWLCAIVPALVLTSWRSLAGLDPVRRVLALVSRSTLIVLIAVCLADVRAVKRSDDLTVLFLMDRSHSVEATETYQEEFIRQTTRKISDKDRMGLIDFARDPFLQQSPMRGGLFIQPGRLPAMPNTDRTDIASALRLAMAMFPEDASKRIVLMSDGNDNMGDVISEAQRAKADGIPIDVVPLWYQHANEVYFERMIAPASADEGEQVSVRMVLHSHKATSGTVEIYQNGLVVPLSPEQSRVELRPGRNTFFLKLPVNSPGTQTYEAVFKPDSPDHDAIVLNNTASAFTFVSGSARVLLISFKPEYDMPLADALRSESVYVNVKSTDELGEFGLLQMMNYSAILLANVPAAAFTEQQQQELAIFVRDLGSGLIMLGGDESFGAGGWIGTPLEEVMPVDFEIKHKKVIPKGALVLIMHSCEIARGNYWAKEMGKKSLDTISSQDYFGVLAYSFSPGGENWEVPLQTATNKASMRAKIDRMQNGDMPDFSRTMTMAYDELTAGVGKDAAQKHVIILSDGDAQPPTSAQLQQYTDAQITVSTIAIGWGVHVQQRALVEIAQKTGGRFYAARNPMALPQIFTKESKVVRRPLIIDEPFQPQIVYGDSELLLGTQTDAGIPLLGGMILTSAKQNPNVLVPIVRATEDGEDPVLAHWQYGLGKAVAFTSGMWPVWGRDWTAWPGFARFWAQTVRWCMRQDTPANFDTAANVSGERGRITIDALDMDADYLNDLDLRGKLIGPDREPVPLSFSQTGPGSYAVDFDTAKSGQYLASVQVYDGERFLGTVRTGVSVPFSPEYRDLTTNESLLRQVADISGGRWLDEGPEQAGVFAHDLPPATARRPVWSWVLSWLILPLFLLDVAVRRLASWLALSVAFETTLLAFLLFGLEWHRSTPWGIVGAFVLAEMFGWAMRFRYIGPMFDYLTHSVTALAQIGERSASSLGRLKGKREDVRQELKGGDRAATDATTPEASRSVQAEIKARRHRKFDVGDARGGQASGDLSESLGGAKESESAKDQKPGPDEGSPGEGEESTTSRLLRAKRKKRENE